MSYSGSLICSLVEFIFGGDGGLGSQPFSAPEIGYTRESVNLTVRCCRSVAGPGC